MHLFFIPDVDKFLPSSSHDARFGPNPFFSPLPTLVDPSSVFDEATCAKRQIKKRRKTSISTSCNASPLHTAELALPAAKSPEVSVRILHNIPDAAARERSHCEEASKRTDAKWLFDARLENCNLDL